MKHVVILTMLLVGLITGCQYEEGTETITVNNEFSVDVPHYMSESDKLHPDAVLQYESRFRTVYLLVLKDDKADYTDLDDYAGFATGDLTNRLEETEVTEQENITELNGLPVREFEIEAIVTGQQVAYYIAAVEVPGAYYRILGWTLDTEGKDGESGRKEKYFPDIKAMVHSFKLL